jgi:hypothetical protein
MQLLGSPCLITFCIDDDDLGFELGGYCEELFGDHGTDVYGTLSGGLEH